jgi:hypothetical protein
VPRQQGAETLRELLQLARPPRRFALEVRREAGGKGAKGIEPGPASAVVDVADQLFLVGVAKSGERQEVGRRRGDDEADILEQRTAQDQVVPDARIGNVTEHRRGREKRAQQRILVLGRDRARHADLMARRGRSEIRRC